MTPESQPNFKIYENRPSSLAIICGLAFFINAMMVGLYYGDLKTLIISILFGTFFLAVMLYVTIGRTPKEIIIQDDSIILVPYIFRKREIRYEDLECVVIHPQNESGWLKRSVNGGFIKPKNTGVFVITAEIGKAIRTAYNNKLNRFPIDDLETFRRNRRQTR